MINRSRLAAPTPRPESPPATAAVSEPAPIPGPSLDATAVAIVGILITAVSVPSHGAASAAACHAAIGTGIALLLSALLDLRGGLRNLLRPDMMGLASFYFLTLIEFLFPQPVFDQKVDLEQTLGGLRVVFVAFIALLVGRHLWKPKHQPFASLLTREVKPMHVLLIFWTCAALGYLHMLIAVNFDVVEMVKQFMGARFTQPWGRGRLGDWKALLVEFALLIQLIPPIAGIVLARRHRYGPAMFWPMMAMFAFTLFYGFTSGTRNVIGSYLVTFLIGYALAVPEWQKVRVIVVGACCGAAMLISTHLMLEFRTVGLKEWLRAGSGASLNTERTFFVDYNLMVISRLVDYFPEKHAFLGWEIPWMAIVRPIPRALWPGKPIDMSVTVEEIFDEQGLTIASTFAGETYIAGGLIAVALASVLLGGFTGWWNGLNSPRNSEIGILIYASGFFATVITMRSMFVFTTAILPTVAGLMCVRWLLPVAAAGLKKLQVRRGPPPRPIPRPPVAPMNQRSRGATRP